MSTNLRSKEGDSSPDNTSSGASTSVLIIEPFCGGSHKQLVDLLASEFRERLTTWTLPAKKWHWKARTSALYFAQTIPFCHKYRILFCSSVLNLAELVALRPDLSKLKKVLYFHENQLVYPVRKQQERDFQYGYNQILSREHDKDPDLFFKMLKQLSEEGQHFKVSVLGEAYTDVPEIFELAKKDLSQHILHWGYLTSKTEYYSVLQAADVVISTAQHEFFGVAMIEATMCGCFPLCPNKLVYPEIFKSGEFLYNTENQLLKKLRSFCKKPHLVRNKTLELNLNTYSWEELRPQFTELLEL